MEYLGHVVSWGTIGPKPTKIKFVTKWPKLTIVKQLMGFLGLFGYYQRSIKGYASIASPLTDMLKGDRFEWTPRADSTFDKLKQSLVRAPISILPDFSQTFIMETDASDTRIRVVLLQNGHPISYFGKKLPP